MDLLAPSLAAAFLGCLAFAAYVLDLRERARQRRALEEQASAAARAKAIQVEVAAALEVLERKLVTLDSRLREVEPEEDGE